MRKLLSIAMLFCIASSLALAQDRRVSGKVTDSAGDPVIGAAVMLKDGSTGAVTSNDGYFTLEADESDVLVVQSLGYETVEIPVGVRSNFTVVLEDAVHLLDDVVVTGYQTLSKERATGSFDIIDKAQIEKPAGNIATRLIGSAAGLVGTQDAYGNPIFEIRGRSSLTDTPTQPLLVVDGFAIEGGFDSINPNDVESITVLKDAAAASIWGAKSANGVIVVTTKNGVSGGAGTKVTVDYSGFFKVSPKLDLDYTLSEASVDDVIDYEMYGYGRWDSNIWFPQESDYGGGFSTVYGLLNEHRLGHLSEADMNAAIDALRGNNNHDQIRKYLLQNPIVHQENVSINIATERSTTTLSLLYQNDRQHYKRNDSNKYMVNFRNRTHLFKWLDFNFNGSYTYTQSDNSGSGLPGLSPYEMLVDENGNYIPYSYGVSLYYVDRHVPEGAFPYSDWSWNPLQEMDNRSLTSTSSVARIQAGLTVKIWKGLTFDSRVQYEMMDSHTHNYYNENTYTVRNTVNTAASWDKETDVVTPNLPTGGFLDQSRTRRDVITFRNQLNFNHTFVDRHAIAFVAGVETIDNRYQSFGYPRTYGYNDETLSVGNFPNGIGGTGVYQLTNWQDNNITFGYQNSFSYMTDRYFSAFGNLSYTYDNRYTVSGSARTDASNLITDDPKYRYSPFWSVGASWQIANESFMEDVSWIDQLTLRATFGYNGNVDKSTTFKPLVNISSSPTVVTGEHTGSMSSYGNPTLRWERTGTWDVGVDFNFFRSKLYGKIDVYNKHSEDLIADVTIPAVQGTTSMRLNNGEILNRGFELEVGSALRISRNVTWDGMLTLSYNRNRVASLQQEPTYPYALAMYAGTSSAWMEGYDMSTLWCYQYGGLINTGTEDAPAMKPTILHKSGLRETFDTWPTGEPMDISYYMGVMTAPWNMSFSTSFHVYDFDISLILTGKFGHKFMRESFNYPGISGRAIPNAKYSEVVNGDPNEIIPLPQTEIEERYYFWNRFYPYMSYLAVNASHIRVQEINVAYNLPKTAVARLRMQSLQVYLQCNNPFNIYFNGYGEDPEFGRGSMRLQAAYTIGLKFKF